MKIFSMLFLLIFAASCQNIEENKVPDNLIPEDKMVKVLTDLAILNSAKNYNTRILEETGIKPDDYLYKKYNIDSTSLELSTKYYAKNYNDFEAMYTKVKVNLEKMKSKLELVKEREDKIKDSIKEAERIEDSIKGIDSTLVKRDSLITGQRIIK